jgi:hypothetical protein
MLVRLKMKTEKRILALALIIATTFAVMMTPIYAQSDEAGNQQQVTSQQKIGVDSAPQSTNRNQLNNQFREMLSNAEGLRQQSQNQIMSQYRSTSLDEYDETEVDDLLDAVTPEDIQEEAIGGLWLVHLQGSSWKVDDTEDSVDTASYATPISMNIAVRKVKEIEQGVLYKVTRGVLRHAGETVKVEGYIILRGRVFAMKLRGEGVDLKAVGAIAPAGIGVRVAMRGRMTHNEEDYGFKMTGKAAHVHPAYSWENTQTNTGETKPLNARFSAQVMTPF